MRLVKVFSLIFILLSTEISIADTKKISDKIDSSNSELTAADTQKIRDLLKQVNELKEEVNKETNTQTLCVCLVDIWVGWCSRLH